MPKIKAKRKSTPRSAALKRSKALRRSIAKTLAHGEALLATADGAIERSQQLRLGTSHKAKTKHKSTRSKASYKAAVAKAWAKRRGVVSSVAVTGHVTGHYVKPVTHEPHASVKQQPIRGQLLDRAKALTLGDREQAYGDPLTNFELVGKLKHLFWTHSIGSRSSSWGHAIDMILTNLARIATAPTPEAALAEDRYVDLCGYASLAYEVGKRS